MDVWITRCLLVTVIGVCVDYQMFVGDSNLWMYGSPDVYWSHSSVVVWITRCLLVTVICLCVESVDCGSSVVYWSQSSVDVWIIFSICCIYSQLEMIK